jgi:NAD(P)-dependent dehydrogenase (short-subunit alcohol dehydrogenase family)
MAVALITGCGSGIGRVMAGRLAELGHNVHAGVRRGDKAPSADRERAVGSLTYISISLAGGLRAAPVPGGVRGKQECARGTELCLAAEVREFGVRVLVVSHGSFNTGAHLKPHPPDVDTGVERYRAVLAAKKRESVELKVGRDPIEVASVIGDY